MNQNRLLKEILRQPKDDVAALRTNVVHQLNKRPAIVDVPQQVGKENQKRDRTADPYPVVEEGTPLWCDKKPDDYAESEKSDGIFFFESDTCDHAEPQPIARVI